jgi:hypothetical protein
MVREVDGLMPGLPSLKRKDASHLLIPAARGKPWENGSDQASKECFPHYQPLSKLCSGKIKSLLKSLLHLSTPSTP